MKININPFNHGNPMTLRDATIVSSLGAAATMLLTVFSNATYTLVAASPGEFAFNCVKSFLTSWAGMFIVLSGLEKYVQKQEVEKTVQT